MLFLLPVLCFRQKGDCKLIEILKRVSTASLTEDVHIVLSSLQVPENVVSLPPDATRILFTNAEVDSYNNEKLNSLPGQMFVSKSVVTSPVGCRPKVAHGKTDDTAFSDLVSLQVGSRVMLVYNVDVKVGLTNGQLGTIVGNISSDLCLIDCVLVSFDDKHIGTFLANQYTQFQKTYPGAVPIFKAFVSYQLGGKSQHGARSHLLQLPLRLAWALICHKVQGQTFPSGQKVIIKWDRSLQPGMAYVMLSRAKSMSDISITGDFSPRQLRCNAEAKLMCDFRQLPERSATSTANIFLNSPKLRNCCLNIQSLNANIEDLKADYLINSCDFLLLSETWLETSYPVLDLQPRVLTSRHLKEGRGRGLSKYSTHTNCEIQLHNSMIKILVKAASFSIIGVYRNHQCPFSLFMDNLLNRITDETAIIIGDFNSPGPTRIEGFLEKLGFRQLVATPTHCAGNKLDLCFVRYIDVSLFVHPCYYFHHDCICVTVNSIKS